MHKDRGVVRLKAANLRQLLDRARQVAHLFVAHGEKQVWLDQSHRAANDRQQQRDRFLRRRFVLGREKETRAGELPTRRVLTGRLLEPLDRHFDELAIALDGRGFEHQLLNVRIVDVLFAQRFPYAGGAGVIEGFEEACPLCLPLDRADGLGLDPLLHVSESRLAVCPRELDRVRVCKHRCLAELILQRRHDFVFESPLVRRRDLSERKHPLLVKPFDLLGIGQHGFKRCFRFRFGLITREHEHAQVRPER